MTQFKIEKGDDAVRISGRLTLTGSAGFWADLNRQLTPKSQRYRVDLSRVESADGGSTALLVAIQSDVSRAGGTIEFAGANDEVRKLLDLYGARVDAQKPQPRRVGMLAKVGLGTLDFVASTRDILAFVGDVTLAVARSIRSPRSVNWADVGFLMERAGADGVPIVALINFLIGLIMALQSAPQLKQFGANIFVADLVGLAVTRELAPLMTAIIVCGRSGAAFAAELGTMKVSEEVDAIRTLGLDPQRFLILPRLIALVLMVPLLTLLADGVGCFGGLFVAVSVLDLTPSTYVNQLRSAMDLWDVFGGMIKAAVFAATITLISCQRGLATRGGAAGVGSSTTSAVVTILFSVILLDAVFTWLYALLGI